MVPLGHGRACPGHPDSMAQCHPDRDRRDKPGDDAMSFAPVTKQVIIALLRDMYGIPIKGHRMPRADILVINPNSNPAVTAGLDAAPCAFRLAGGPSIRFTTLPEGAFGIEYQKDLAQVQLTLRPPVLQVNEADSIM